MIGYRDGDSGMPFLSLFHKVGDVPPHMHPCLREKRYYHDAARPLSDTHFHGFLKRGPDIVQKCMLDDRIAGFFHLSGDQSKSFICTLAFTPVSEDYDGGLHED